MKEKDIEIPIQEEENGTKASEPVVGAYAYPGLVEMDEPDYDFGGKDLGLPRTMDEVEAELLAADRELNNSAKWVSMHDFLSDFKQEHSAWLK